MRINLGSGSDIKSGWINIDSGIEKQHGEKNGTQLMNWDLTKGLPPVDLFQRPIKDIEYVYSSHFLEHMFYQQSLNLLRDCHSKMIPGGIIRVCLPNFLSMAKAYLNKDWDFFGLVRSVAPDNQIMQIINYGIYQHSAGINEHKQVFDPEYGMFTLRIAGFKDVKEVPFDPSIDMAAELRTRYSFYIEGTK